MEDVGGWQSRPGLVGFDGLTRVGQGYLFVGGWTARIRFEDHHVAGRNVEHPFDLVRMPDAVRQIAQDVQEGRLAVEDIDEEAIGARLYTRGMSDPDLMIRTAGEMRISNFLLGRSATPSCG